MGTIQFFLIIDKLLKINYLIITNEKDNIKILLEIKFNKYD